MNEIAKVDYKEFGLAESKAHEIEMAFTPFVQAMDELAPELNKFIENLGETPTTEDIVVAKELRLAYVKTRTGTSTVHKEQKAVFLNAGRFIDSLKNAQKKAADGIEEYLKQFKW